VGWIHLAQDIPVAGAYESDNEPSGSTKGGEYLYQLSGVSLIS
jgi:hypothetical protein